MGGRRATKTGDEPGVTKVEQKLMLGHDCLIFDTPGMLWPKIAAPQAGWNLAASGAVGRNALDEELVALELIERLQAGYPQALQARYGLSADTGANAEELLALLARKRGASSARACSGASRWRRRSSSAPGLPPRWRPSRRRPSKPSKKSDARAPACRPAAARVWAVP